MPGHRGRLKGHLGRQLLGFYLGADMILEQKSIRINIVFRERTKETCKMDKEGETGSRKKQPQ